jgi:heme/copper-type cytochrome/quinol oxidase subunit 3
MTETVWVVDELPVGSIGRRSNGWWAMLFVILTEGALFAYLLFAYYYLAIQPHADWPPGGAPSMRLALPNTFILMASSVAAWWGERAIKRNSTGRLCIGLAVTIVLGLIFVGVQAAEWHNKPFSLASTTYSSLYFTITGFHMAHVAVGLLILVALLVWSALGMFDHFRHAPISVGAIYWHFVDAVWLAVFLTFYVTPHLGLGHG